MIFNWLALVEFCAMCYGLETFRKLQQPKKAIAEPSASMSKVEVSASDCLRLLTIASECFGVLRSASECF